MKRAAPDLYLLEQVFREQGVVLLCGVDEAGRGPLAGPVCAGAVILDPAKPIEGLDDSKKLSPKRREILFSEITAKALAFGVGWAGPEEIDAINILQATFAAMRRAVESMGLAPELVLVDGNRDPGLGVATKCMVKGDSHYASIAAASILAKVSRDQVMEDLAKQYPAYGFEVHKGYPTKAHRQAVLEHGPSPVHRRTFLKKLLGDEAR